MVAPVQILLDFDEAAGSGRNMPNHPTASTLGSSHDYTNDSSGTEGIDWQWDNTGADELATYLEHNTVNHRMRSTCAGTGPGDAFHDVNLFARFTLYNNDGNLNPVFKDGSNRINMSCHPPIGSGDFSMQLYCATPGWNTGTITIGGAGSTIVYTLTHGVTYDVSMSLDTSGAPTFRVKIDSETVYEVVLGAAIGTFPDSWPGVGGVADVEGWGHMRFYLLAYGRGQTAWTAAEMDAIHADPLGEFGLGASGPSHTLVSLGTPTETTLPGPNTFNVTGAAPNGELFGAIYLPGNTPTDEADVANGVGAENGEGALKSPVVADGNVSLGLFTGLTSNTPYNLVTVVNDDLAQGGAWSTILESPFTTANANPVIDVWTISQVNAVTVQTQLRLLDDEPTVEYLIAAYPDGTGAAISDADLQTDCQNAGGGAGGVPSPNPRGCLWAVSRVETQGTTLNHVVQGLAQLTSYDIEHAGADTANITRGASSNVTTGQKRAAPQTAAQNLENADATAIGARTGWNWQWFDRAGALEVGDAAVHAGVVDTDASGFFTSDLAIPNSTLSDGQTGKLVLYLNDTTDSRIREMILDWDVDVQQGTEN